MTQIAKQNASYRWCRVFLSSAYRLFLRCCVCRTCRQTPSPSRPQATVAASSITLTNNFDFSPQGPTWAARWATGPKQTQRLLTVLTLVVSLVSPYGLRITSLVNAPWDVTWQRKIRTYNNCLGIKIRTYVNFLRHRIVLGTSRARIYEDRRREQSQ